MPLRKWTAVDAVMLWEKLRKAGYDDFFEANLEDPSFELPVDYDVAVLLHILEHLFEPEAALQKVARQIRPGGALIGGFPVVPAIFARMRERKIRRTAAPMGHVSVFSPARVRRMAKDNGLRLEFIERRIFCQEQGESRWRTLRFGPASIFCGARFFPDGRAKSTG